MTLFIRTKHQLNVFKNISTFKGHRGHVTFLNAEGKRVTVYLGGVSLELFDE